MVSLRHRTRMSFIMLIFLLHGCQTRSFAGNNFPGKIVQLKSLLGPQLPRKVSVVKRPLIGPLPQPAVPKVHSHLQRVKSIQPSRSSSIVRNFFHPSFSNLGTERTRTKTTLLDLIKSSSVFPWPKKITESRNITAVPKSPKIRSEKESGWKIQNNKLLPNIPLISPTAIVKLEKSLSLKSSTSSSVGSENSDRKENSFPNGVIEFPQSVLKPATSKSNKLLGPSILSSPMTQNDKPLGPLQFFMKYGHFGELKKKEHTRESTSATKPLGPLQFYLKFRDFSRMKENVPTSRTEESYIPNRKNKPVLLSPRSHQFTGKGGLIRPRLGEFSPSSWRTNQIRRVNTKPGFTEANSLVTKEDKGTGRQKSSLPPVGKTGVAKTRNKLPSINTNISSLFPSERNGDMFSKATAFLRSLDRLKTRKGNKVQRPSQLEKKKYIQAKSLDQRENFLTKIRKLGRTELSKILSKFVLMDKGKTTDSFKNDTDKATVKSRNIHVCLVFKDTESLKGLLTKIGFAL